MLSLKEISDEMSSVKEWSIEGDMIVKSFNFTNFKEALDFINKVGEIAEAQNHHPGIILDYNLVRLSLTTHSEKGLTKKDFELAREIDVI